MAFFMLLQPYCGGCAGAVDKVPAALGVAFAAAVEAPLDWMGTQGCCGAFCPGSAVVPASRIIPAGHGASSGVGSRSTGSGGAFATPFSSTSCFDPGHT